MTLRNRILDLLPALLVFVAVSAFTTYVAIAYVVHDPWWLSRMAEHSQQLQQMRQGDGREGARPHRAATPDDAR